MELQSELASTGPCIQINCTVGGINVVAVEYVPRVNACEKVLVANSEV